MRMRLFKVLVVILAVTGIASIGSAQRPRPGVGNPFRSLWRAVWNLQDQIDELNERQCECKPVSWKHTIAESDIVGPGRVFVMDARFAKDSDVSVYVVREFENIAFEAINASYELRVQEGGLLLQTFWDNGPIGEELLIFVSYHE